MSLSSDDKKKLSRFLNSPIMHDQITVTRGWKNFMKTQETADAVVINITSRMALHSLILEINSLNKDKDAAERIILRAAAGGRDQTGNSASYSATECVNADIIVRLTGHDFSKVSRIPNSNVVRVGASIQIGELDKILYEKHHLVLPTASLIPYVTAAGLAAAGGHGTGIDQPSFAGLVCGITLCTESGEIVHIDRSHPDFQTILGANNGLFGFVMDMDIECSPRMKLECVMQKRSPIEFMEEVENGLFDRDPYVSAMYVPTYLPDELTSRTVNNVIIYRWRPVPMDTKDVNHTPFIDNFEQRIQTELGSAINIPEILRTYPKLIPFYLRHIASPLTVGDKTSLSVGPWYDLMHYRTSFPEDLDEICGLFPVKDQPRRAKQGAEIVKAMKHAITLLDEHAKRGEYPVTYAMYFRFLQGTNGGLSITDVPAGHHVCSMDLTSNENIKGFAEFKKNMQDFFLNEMNAKLHWGKNAPKDLDYEKIYGARWQETKAALEKWHRTFSIDTEKSMLLNPLFSKVFGYPPPSLEDTVTVPARVLRTDKSYHVAVNARKFAAVIGDGSDECRNIQNEINADINKAKKGTMFPSSTQSGTSTANNRNSTCTIL